MEISPINTCSFKGKARATAMTGTRMWHFFGHGDWHGPFSFDEITDLTSPIPRPFLMASGINDAQLNVVQTYPKIGGLALVSPHITLAATGTLRALPDLRELILCGPPISDDFLLDLIGMTTLREITLVHTACTQHGVRKFVESVPDCDVYKGGKHSIFPAFDRLELHPFLLGI